jgi:hypothetical protein
MFDLLQAVGDGIGLIVEIFSLLETAWSLLLDIGQALRWLRRRIGLAADERSPS